VRSSKLIAALTFVALLGLPARAETFPDHPVRLIIPFAPGGSIDTLGRILSEKLSTLWGQSVVVENRPGAGGTVGSSVAAQAAPDGHTIVFGGQFMAANVTIAPSQTFDPVKSFAPLILVATGQDCLMVPVNSPFHSVKEIIDYAKTHPGELTYASLGVGSSGQLASTLFSEVTGITLQHVPYNSFSQAVTDVSAGRISVWLTTLGGSIGHIQAGKLRALAVSGPTRAALLPDVPTFDELGVAYGNDTSWYALFAPAGTPREVIGKINADTNKILTDPDMQQRATRLGFRLVGGTPEALGAHLKSEIDKWAKVAKAAGLAAVKE
jgi:tripartite-type tricarboxylate transporter receptor subunit TctC